MNDEIGQKIVTLGVTASKLTIKEVYRAIKEEILGNKGDKVIKGEQKLKNLLKQGEGLSNVELDVKLGQFKKELKKYGVDFSAKQVKGATDKYIIFFKSKDIDMLNQALKEYLIKDKKRISIKTKLKNNIKEKPKKTKVKTKKRTLGAR